MRLRNIHAYNLIRALRAIVPIIVLVLVAIPVWNYLTREATRTTAVDPLPGLVDDVREVTEEIRYTQREDGRRLFSVEAARNVGMADGRQLLEGVRITIAGQDASTPDRLIDSDHCNVDEASGDFACTENIQIQFDDQTEIRTTEIGYHNETHVITALAASRIVRTGSFEADAAQLSFRVAEDVLEVSGGVEITTAGHVTLRMDRASYYRRENRIELAGGVRLRSPAGEIRSRESSVFLIPDTLDPRQVWFSGSVTAASADTEEPLSVGADSLRVDLVARELDQVTASGAARVEAADAGGRRVLSGDTVAGYFSDVGKLELIEAVGGGRMLLEDGAELRAERIRNEVADSTLRTGDGSTLELGEYRVEGSEFVVRQGGEIQFSTARPSVIRFPNGKLQAPDTIATFDPGSGLLVRLLQSGGATFSREGLEGAAEQIELDAGGRVVLSGDARVSGRELRLEGDRIVLSEDGGSFSASGSVRAVVSRDGAPTLIEGSRAEGDDTQVTFHTSAELWRDNTQVQASTSIEIRLDERRFRASGEVVSIIGDSRVWADLLEFDDGAGTVLYSGSVRSRFPGTDLDAAEIEVRLADSEIQTVLARGGVEIRGSGVVGRGDAATYDEGTGDLTLVGSNATVSAPDTGVSTGPRFVWNVDDARVVMTGDDANRAVSRRALEP